MKIAVLHTRLSGYFSACLRELSKSTSTELLIYAWPNQADAPFDLDMLSDLGIIRNRTQHLDSEISRAVFDFCPDVILVSGWADKGYLKICQEARKQGVPVIAGCDTQWKGSLRQHVASWIAPWHVRKAIDVLWVTGERQAILARALGYDGDCLWAGYYACDWEMFASGWRPDDGEQRSEIKDRRSFLFVGRYVPEKGIDTLVEAYGRYRREVQNPWPLVCAGAGLLRDSLAAAGAEDVGFVQPADLPSLMAGAGAFVLPSRFEPWGVVVQEAAASGLPLICSDACGAGVHLLRDRWNGRSFAAGDPSHLVECLLWMHQQSDQQLHELGLNSFELSKQYTPRRWVETLLEGIKLKP